MKSTRTLVFTALFAALAAAVGFALFEIPNVELVTFTVFIAGVYLGPLGGFVSGVIGEGLFSGLNPLGSGLAFPPLFLAQILGYGFIGFIGGLYHKSDFRLPGWIYGVQSVGLVLVYIILTLTATAFVGGVGEKGVLAWFVLGIHFYIAQLGVNFIVFTAITKQVVRTLRNLRENAIL